MDKNFDVKFKVLPPYIQSWMADESTALNDKIASKYNLDLIQTGQMVDIISKIILAILPWEDFLNLLEKALPKLDKKVIKALALDIALIRFWPIRDYLTKTEKLIGELGGVIPTNTALYKNKYVGEVDIKKEAKNISDNVINVSIGGILKQYPEIKSQFITSKPIILQEGAQPVNATLLNWLEDYKKKKGNPPHSGAEREDYLINTNNTANLDNSERTILRGLLKSYDEGGELPLDSITKKIVLSELFKNGSLLTTPTYRHLSSQKKNETPSKTLPSNIINLKK